MKRVTASRAALLAVCQYPFREGVRWDESTGRSAKQGDEFHKGIAPVVDVTITAEPFPPTTKWYRERMAHATEWVAEHYVPGWRAEVAYAYDPAADTGRILGYNIGREYEQHGKLPHEIAGSADLEWLASGGTVVAQRDWKTGRSVTDSVWPQLELLGLMGARAHRAATAIVGPLHVTDYGVGDTMQSHLGPAELAVVATDLRTHLAMIDDAWPAPGAHCDALFCPARVDCDVYQAMKGAA